MGVDRAKYTVYIVSGVCRCIGLDQVRHIIMNVWHTSVKGRKGHSLPPFNILPLNSASHSSSAAPLYSSFSHAHVTPPVWCD